MYTGTSSHRQKNVYASLQSAASVLRLTEIRCCSSPDESTPYGHSALSVPSSLCCHALVTMLVSVPFTPVSVHTGLLFSNPWFRNLIMADTPTVMRLQRPVISTVSGVSHSAGRRIAGSQRPSSIVGSVGVHRPAGVVKRYNTSKRSSLVSYRRSFPVPVLRLPPLTR